MKKFKLITALLALAAFGAVLAKNIAKPDFAFPSKAVTESATTLSDLLKTDDTKGIVRSLINYSLARNEISTDYLPADIRRVDSIAAAESDPAARSILRLLEAEMLSGIYT
ncbi:MAG: hypothetical protein K2J07_00715, partial [Muribaculaceae bacterium]|nr:hypothetical protein [Muribaculaceae bacterium]